MITIFLTVALLMPGCYREAVDKSLELPVIIWPKSPEIPRIYFIKSISGPEDINIKESGIKKFFDLLTGFERKSIIKPYGLETDGKGKFFVVDITNKLVHVFDTKHRAYYSFPGKETQLESPIDIAVAKNGNVYITDSQRAVVKIFRDFGQKYEGEIGEGVFERPTGIAINEITNELLVVDTKRSQIIRYALDDLSMIGTVGRNGEEQGMFHFPTNIFVLRDGRIFVTDTLNFRIQIFNPDWEFLNSFGKAGNGPGYFSKPKGVAVDSDGNIYVVDALFDNVQIFSAEGNLLMDFGGPGYGYGEFWLPSGIFIDSKDRIYVSDTYNKRVQIFQYLKDGEY
jgi:DNA-binding beta-propeller fold protein YncE